MLELLNSIFLYLKGEGKAKIAILAIIFIFVPFYVVDFLFFRDWFMSTDFVKITVLNAGIIVIAYVIQFVIFQMICMMFTKKGRTKEDMILFPLLILGCSVYIVLLARIFTDRFLFAILISLIASVICNIIEYIWYEKNLKLLEACDE